ncbi:hypothetical protein DRN85_06675 [Methanosarcinales archaeon]|nr:MAG: hypothetical protein DRN85_06675 [Methanosarcinales archaeon]
MEKRKILKRVLRKKIGKTYINGNIAIHKSIRLGFEFDIGRYSDPIFEDNLLINYLDLDIYLGFFTVYLNLNRAGGGRDE